jgi:hypothetical protein
VFTRLISIPREASYKIRITDVISTSIVPSEKILKADFFPPTWRNQGRSTKKTGFYYRPEIIFQQGTSQK